MMFGMHVPYNAFNQSNSYSFIFHTVILILMGQILLNEARCLSAHLSKLKPFHF